MTIRNSLKSTHRKTKLCLVWRVFTSTLYKLTKLLRANGNYMKEVIPGKADFLVFLSILVKTNAFNHLNTSLLTKMY